MCVSLSVAAGCITLGVFGLCVVAVGELLELGKKERTVKGTVEDVVKDRDGQRYKDVVDYMSVFDSKTKYLRKNNVAVILKLAEQMLLEGIEAEAYRAFLNEFFSTDNEDYKEHSGAGNVKRVNVEARYDILKRECYKYFNLGSTENSEINDNQLSLEGDVDEAV